MSVTPAAAVPLSVVIGPFGLPHLFAAPEPVPGSYQHMDYGSVIAETIRSVRPEGNTAYKGLATPIPPGRAATRWRWHQPRSRSTTPCTS